MGQRLIISENERSQIAKMYGLVNEQSLASVMYGALDGLGKLYWGFLKDNMLPDELKKKKDDVDSFLSKLPTGEVKDTIEALISKKKTKELLDYLDKQKRELSGKTNPVNEQSFMGNDGYDNSQVNYNLSFVYPTDLLEKIKTFRTYDDILNYMRSLRPQKNENWFKVLPDVKFRPFEDLLALYPSIGNEIMNRFKATGNLRDNNPEVQKLGQLLGNIRKNGEKNLLSLTRWMESKLGRTENGEDTPLCKDEELADLSKQPGTKIISLPAPFNSQYYLVRNKPYCYTEA